MRVLHVCNGMREYDFFFIFFSPFFISAPFILYLFSFPVRVYKRPRRVDRRSMALVSHPRLATSFPLLN